MSEHGLHAGRQSLCRSSSHRIGQVKGLLPLREHHNQVALKAQRDNVTGQVAEFAASGRR